MLNYSTCDKLKVVHYCNVCNQHTCTYNNFSASYSKMEVVLTCQKVNAFVAITDRWRQKRYDSYVKTHLFCTLAYKNSESKMYYQTLIKWLR